MVDPGNSFNTALNVGILGSLRTFQNFVGTTDRDDYYRFNLTQTSNFNLKLSGLSDRAQVDLFADLDGDGQIESNEVLRSSYWDAEDKNINVSFLGAGTYFVKVFTPFEDNNTNYKLELSATVNTPSNYDDYIIATYNDETFYALAGRDRIEGGSGNDRIFGGLGNDVLLGQGDNDMLNGGVGNDRLYGDYGNDVLFGDLGNDILVGAVDNDFLAGGAGFDTLTGGAGRDRFHFKSRLEGRDRITDFNPFADTISVSAAGFGGGLRAGTLLASQFVLGASALDSNDRFIYQKTTGALFFDIDGTGAAAKIQIATLNAGLTMTNADIVVVA
jgi:Ca2+-binding RTX toxin-like protein